MTFSDLQKLIATFDGEQLEGAVECLFDRAGPSPVEVAYDTNDQPYFRRPEQERG